LKDHSSLPEAHREEAANSTAGLIQVSCYSDAGKVRKRNEDTCALPTPGANKAEYGTLLALADGIGGLPGGAEASQEAVGSLMALYYSEVGPSHPADRLREAVGAVNALICYKKRQLDYAKGYLTTLVAAVTLSDQIWIANVGDSRAYRILSDPGKIQQLTEDHSGHVRNVKSGLADESDIASQRTGIITRAIGLSEECQVDTYHYSWEPGDRLLLCSDGLNSLPAEEMASISLTNPPETAARKLVSRAVELDGSDNCTVIVAAWLQPETAPIPLPEDQEVTQIGKPRSPTQTETPKEQEINTATVGPSTSRRSPRRSIWLDILGPVLIGILVGLAIAVLAVMLLIQWEVLSLSL
jgi:protein phosphatase